ncbi:2-polyprenyl-6-methoxyphenol hydroxylase [Salinihabitans flavidus]|uniref:2-polyprenyl-6-methoxyphenol hydroxylase n=1 Tax=Salinihabitans flavidus TaxID=569882 RepID=A0A1H8NUC1_9RHOB|nr:flavin-dependent oxidoreductase [Salinihabitans flavidus]SEO33246.1 2-polyprenyl-6-methoxyphenol hydroxylase [Salinihabitans flavidus]
MTVLIAGGGIAGLTLGLSLHQVGVPFRIFEAVETIRPLGVGLNLQPHAVRELMALGLEDGLDLVGLRTAEVAYFSRQGGLIWAEPRGQEAGYRWPQFSIHRGGLQMLLFRALQELAPGAIRTGAAIRDWDETAQGVKVRLCNRVTGHDLGVAEGTVLVGADGINSSIRARLYPDEGPARWGGTMMWRGVSYGPRFRGGRSMAMIGEKARKFVVYPIADTEDGGSLLNWIADLTMPEGYRWREQDWNRAGKFDDFLPRFSDWRYDWLDVPGVIGAAQAVYEFPMVDRDPLPRWSFGPVSLIGDAAHAMYPIGSNGASQGIMDARVLARALRDIGPVPKALCAYEDARRESVNALVLRNRGDGPDRILNIVAARAPEGFEDIETVMPEAERAALADDYRRAAGMEMAALNASDPIIPP